MGCKIQWVLCTTHPVRSGLATAYSRASTGREGACRKRAALIARRKERRRRQQSTRPRRSPEERSCWLSTRREEDQKNKASPMLPSFWQYFLVAVSDAGCRVGIEACGKSSHDCGKSRKQVGMNDGMSRRRGCKLALFQEDSFGSVWRGPMEGPAATRRSLQRIGNLVGGRRLGKRRCRSVAAQQIPVRQGPKAGMLLGCRDGLRQGRALLISTSSSRAFPFSFSTSTQTLLPRSALRDAGINPHTSPPPPEMITAGR